MTQNGANGNGHLPIHELATMFPPMSEEEFIGLKSDIAEHGIHQPIAVWRGAVIDGRNRYLAAHEVGIDPPFRYLDDDIDPVDFVLSANMSRRNLDSSQRSIVMSALPKLKVGDNQHREDTKYLVSSRTSRAKRASVSDELQRQADTVFTYGDQAIINQIRSGRLTVTDAYNGIRTAREANARAEKAEKEQVQAAAAAKAEREALERAKAEREAAEREAVARRAAAEKAEREVNEKARAEHEIIERARAEREAAAKAEREALERAKAEREAAEREAVARRAAAEKAERVAVERARAERESALLAAAQQQMADDPKSRNLVKELKNQQRKEALATAQVAARAIRSNGHHPWHPDDVQIGDRSRVIFANNLDPDLGLPTLEDESVSLTFTSPPYWNFVDYGHGGSGYEESYQEYIASLRGLFGVIFQKTIPGGRAVINVSNMKSRQDIEGRAFVYPIVADTIKAMMIAGFTFFDEIIWHKRDATTSPMDGSPLWGSYPYPPTPKILDSIFENILVFTKPGHRDVDLGAKELSRLTVEEWREYTNGVWRLESGSDPNHPATFPMELADRVIRMYSFVNDVVLDPFAGTGTAVVSAERNRRAGIGYEISPTYKAAVHKKAEGWLNDDEL